MTNEELCELIQQGCVEMLPLLWEKVHKLVYWYCSRIYWRHERRFRQHGIEEEDLKQSSYFAFLGAIKAYRIEKGLKFGAYLPFQLKKVMRNMMGTKRRERDPLNLISTKSLDEPISKEDGESAIGDITPDPLAAAPFEEIEQRDVARVVHEAVNELPELQRNVIQLYYFENKTFETVSCELKINRDRARLAEEKALRNLRKSELLEDLRTVTYRGRSAAVCQRLGSTVEADVERREKLREIIRRRDEKNNRIADQDAVRHKRLQEILGRSIGNDTGTA